MQPGATIIVVTYNSGKSITRCVKSVLATLRPIDELFIIDNASSDDSLQKIAECAKQDDSRLRVFPQESNLGFSRACNFGIRASDKEFVILLNPDTEVFHDWIARLTSHFRLYQKTGAVGALTNSGLKPQQVCTYFPDYFEHNHDVDQLLTVLKQRFDKKSIPVRLLMGFCLALNRELLERHGLLDEDIFLGDEDMEMSWRLRENGYLLRVALDVFLNHERHSSFKQIKKSRADELVQQGTDVLFSKMQAYYYPKKVPDPVTFFNISWWRPSALDQASYDDLFDAEILPFAQKEILAHVKQLLAQKKLEKATEILEASLHILVTDYFLWYMLGSVYLLRDEFDKADFALENAAAFETTKTAAQDKLQELRRKPQLAQSEMEN